MQVLTGRGDWKFSKVIIEKIEILQKNLLLFLILVHKYTHKDSPAAEEWVKLYAGREARQGKANLCKASKCPT